MEKGIAWQIDPTSACNLQCPGCWAGKYEQSDRISPERLDELMDKMKELGIYWVVLSGGEPFMYPHLIEILEKHNDMAFMAYTNGTLINESMADELARVGNLSPAFSLEGWRENTDARRGEGTFDRVVDAMQRCADRGIPFGTSLTATSQNVGEICSERFMSFLDEQRAIYVWIFHYIPIGRSPDLDMMLSPQQRLWMLDQIDRVRRAHPMVIVDFWNDGHYVNGCIAGGRFFAHINAAGDVEPCGFAHFSLDNINDTSLLEALNSGLFAKFAENQPFNDNHLAPCPIIENPHALRKIVRETGARGTHADAEKLLCGDTAEHLDRLSECWRRQSAERSAGLAERGHCRPS